MATPEIPSQPDTGPSITAIPENTETVRSPEFALAQIAFDGCCRVGKGEQLKELHGYLTSRGVPSMVLKGDGTRLGAGEAWHDLGSRAWTYVHDYFGGMHPPLEEWDKASYDLARENKAWVTALQRIAVVSRSRFAAAIYDRSIISRATLALERENLPEGQRLTAEQMYPARIQTEEPVNYYATMPDILFNLVAPQEVLMERIQPDDYDRAFRVRAVNDYFGYFRRAKDSLPEGTTTKIVELDGLQPIDYVADQVREHLEDTYPEFVQLRDVKPMYANHT